MKHIQFSDLKSQYNECRSDIDSAIQKVLDNGNYILGQEVSDLEKEFAEYSGYKYGVGVSSGTAAIDLLLRTYQKRDGSEIVLPANTFIASCIGAMEAGFKVRLCDVDEETQLMTADSVTEAMTDYTDFIMGVNLFGEVVPDEVPMVAEKTNRIFMYDACQSHGALQKNYYPSCYSFYPAKNFGGIGDGGMILTNDASQYQKLLKMRAYGSTHKYVHDSYGRNERLDTINAAVLLVKLKKLDGWNKKRNEVAKLYDELLQNVGDVKSRKVIGKSNSHLYVIRTKYRDELQRYLIEKGVPAQIHYPTCVHQNKVYDGYDFGNWNHFPIAEKLSNEILSLPMHPYLTTEEVEYIVESIYEFFKTKA